MARRNIMRKFRITEISAVDTPCQEGARAAIFKRAEAPVAEPMAQTPDDWRSRRDAALAELETRAKARASARKESFAAAYDAVMAERADLYALTV